MSTSTAGTAARDFASPRVMAHTLALFFAAGGCTALLAASGGSDDAGRRWFVAAAGILAMSVGAAVFRWGLSLPRVVLGGLVTLGSALISTVVWVSPDSATAVACASVNTFVGVMACFFADRWIAVAHIATAVGSTASALTLRGDTPVATAGALAVVVFTLAAVTRTLVIRAFDAAADALTGLANRRGFDEALDEHTRRDGAVLSAALLDLDHFKAINDTSGHEAGDSLLRRVADSWRGSLPAGAVLARHGGDEFALVLPGMSGPEALDEVRRLCALVPDVSVSAGVAERRAGDSSAQLMRGDDLALYRVKADGRGATALHTDAVTR